MWRLPLDISPDELETCLSVLQRIADSRGTIARSDRLNSLVAKVYREGKRLDKNAERQRQQSEDRELQATTAMVQIQRDALSPASPLLQLPSTAVRTLNQPETCYVCKADFTEVHGFYHLLCPSCAAFNFRMRHLRADLTGQTALVTGGRVKIGHQTVLKLLRDGAKVIVTTRFPHAAASRLYAEPDSAEWLHRLRLYGLDLRNLPSVEAFAQHLLQTEPSLEILIHNAAQTVRRPQGFYSELLAQEQRPMELLPQEARRLVVQEAPVSSTMALTDGSAALPALRDVMSVDRFVDNEERLDTRSSNSWMLRLDEVSAPEMLEVQLINVTAPFLLNSRLKPLMTRSSFERRFIVNVSAMEGQFNRHKTVYHPHTNMAKAALNMMTRTSGDDFARDRIYMTSVDTGWITDENPTPKRERGQGERGFFPPLDIIDGASRIYHPVAQGTESPEKPFFGVFLKDYRVCAW
ncbi:MAG TPA: SDR family oxidoreductase [Pantanalinema sp.]